jgi:hypothetical protein
MAIKHVLMEIDDLLWQKAKIEAAKRNIPLKALVTLAIENEIQKAG